MSEVLNINFVKEILSIPTFTKKEYRLIDYIREWSIVNNLLYHQDDYGNVYLTKGIISGLEYYPCVTAHLDSVQAKQIPFIHDNTRLDVQVEMVNEQTKLFVEGMGIGGDDKCGVVIALSLFAHTEKLKVVLFVEEEGGSHGSNHMDIDWFHDVGYVIGFDSPELNRAAYSCVGNRLFSEELFIERIEPICSFYGIDNFRAEPNTDVRNIREKTNIPCMNFGSGYYNPHQDTEYCIYEDMNVSFNLGLSLIEHLGIKMYYFKRHTAHLAKLKYKLKKVVKKIKKFVKKEYNFVLKELNLII